MSAPMRTYVVLAERVVDTDVGEQGFVLLGFYEAYTAWIARRNAAREHGIPDDDKLVAVSSRMWRAE